MNDQPADPLAALEGAAIHLPTVWPAKGWVPVATDRIGEIGAVASIQRSGQDRFFAMTSIYVNDGSGWDEVFANGHEWPQSPNMPRPSGGRPIAMLAGGGSSGVGRAPTTASFIVGVVTTDVSELRAISATGEHRVPVDPLNGIFVALTVYHEAQATYRLVAFDGHGQEIDSYDYNEQ